MAMAKASLRNSRHPPEDRDEYRSNKPPPSLKSKINTNFDDNSEYANLAEKIIQNLHSVLERDDLLDEFDIIPVESKANHSPVLHDVTEHKLALESWCVPYLLTHSYKSFLAIRRKLRPSSASSSPNSSSSSSTLLTQYGSLKASNLSESEKISRGIMLSRVLVLLNPDLTLAWNFRREYLLPLLSSFQCFSNEIRLVSLVATRKPKCPEGFSYRRWLVDKAFKNEILKAENLEEWISSELSSIEHPITRYFSNYHAWNYRLWLLQTIHTKTEVTSELKQLVLENELAFSNRWMNSQVSDYCGHHFRQKLFQFLSEHKNGEDDEQMEIIENRLRNELENNSKQIETFEGHETLWYHRRAIIHDLMKLRELNTEEISGLKKEEENLMNTILSGKSTAECSQLNKKLCRQYATWVNQRFKWNLSTTN